jgi:hypothetical protein
MAVKRLSHKGDGRSRVEVARPIGQLERTGSFLAAESTMVQVGVIMALLSIHEFSRGSIRAGLVCLACGLLFASMRKSHLGMKVTWKRMVTPVEDEDDTPPYVVVARIASYAVFAVAVCVIASAWLDLHFS